ncbi:MAG TPA: twin-arginine translocation signal domain-containing protein [Candidatus Stackebrandtia excrementipullorum]|nr:twin-arginine translocation signal domain-containing protein [Candidatus Stackebrandtia excrementipullorum]
MTHPRISRRGVLGLTAATVAGVATVVTTPQPVHASPESTPASDSEATYTGNEAVECLADLYERRMV